MFGYYAADYRSNSLYEFQSAILRDFWVKNRLPEGEAVKAASFLHTEGKSVPKFEHFSGRIKGKFCSETFKVFNVTGEIV